MTDENKTGNDQLSLSGNNSVKKMMAKHGSKTEKIQYSDFVIKINKRDKEQTRVLLVTDKAL